MASGRLVLTQATVSDAEVSFTVARAQSDSRDCGDDPTLSATRGKWQRDEMRDSINIWQRYASPVWMDINPSDTLQFRSARENEDERHICPLQLDVIRRGIQLWTNPGDVVLDPFMGIASTGYVALEMGRTFIGFELKPSYYECSVKNLQQAEHTSADRKDDLFSINQTSQESQETCGAEEQATQDQEEF